MLGENPNDLGSVLGPLGAVLRLFGACSGRRRGVAGKGPFRVTSSTAFPTPPGIPRNPPELSRDLPDIPNDPPGLPPETAKHPKCSPWVPKILPPRAPRRLPRHLRNFFQVFFGIFFEDLLELLLSPSTHRFTNSSGHPPIDLSTHPPVNPRFHPFLLPGPPICAKRLNKYNKYGDIPTVARAPWKHPRAEFGWPGLTKPF